MLFNELVSKEGPELVNNPQIKDLELYFGPETGIYFTFYMFSAFLIRISMMTLMDFEDLGNNDEKLIYLFERMEMSEGYKLLENRLASSNYYFGQTKQKMLQKSMSLNRISNKSLVFNNTTSTLGLTNTLKEPLKTEHFSETSQFNLQFNNLQPQI